MTSSQQPTVPSTSDQQAGAQDRHVWHTKQQPNKRHQKRRHSGPDGRMSRDKLDRPLNVGSGNASVVPGGVPPVDNATKYGGRSTPHAVADGLVAVVPKSAKAIIIDGKPPAVIPVDELDDGSADRHRKTGQEQHDKKDSKQVATNPTDAERLQYPLFHDKAEEGHYRNPLFRLRSRFRVYLAEYLGTLVLVLWGEGTQAQVIVARNQPNDYLSIAWGWGIGFMLAIYISSGISGGHVNPCVTLSLALFRKFPWKQVPGYFLAQLLGAFTAACIIYGVYFDVLNAVPGSFAGVLVTSSASLVPTLSATFFSVFIGAALLMLAICAFTDTGNNPATPGLTPLLLGLIMVGIASSFGYQTGFVLNPARDFGPRLLMYATGQGGRELWLDNQGYGIWVPFVATCAGAIVGDMFYDVLIYNGRDSPMNTNFSRSGRTFVKRQRTMSVSSKNGNTDGVKGAGAGVTPTPSDMESGRLSGTTITGEDTTTYNKGGSAPPVGVV